MSRRNESATVARAETYLRAGELGRADRTVRSVLRREPRNADAWHLHGLTALHAGNLAKARTRLERAISIREDSSEFHSNLGVVFERLGDLERSYRAHERALALDRDPADTWFNHGLVLLRLGRPTEAVPSLEAARDRDPVDPEVCLNLGRALERSGDGEGALREYRNALARAKGPGERWVPEIRNALRRVLRVVFPAEAAPDIRRLLVDSGVGPDLESAAAAQLRRGAPRPEDGGDAALRHAVSCGRLLRRYLREVINLDPGLERLLTAARARLLREWTDAGPSEASSRAAGTEGRLAAALATQCFFNEFVWYASPEEEAWLAGPAGRLGRALAGTSHLDPTSLASDLLLVSLYRPPSAIEGADRLSGVPTGDWSPPVEELLSHSLHGPREELAIARSLPAIGTVRDATSRAVQAQYEENPYPRWLSLPSGPDATLAEALGRRFPDRPVPDPIENVLVAGGGTGYEPLLVARGNPGAQVLSLDLSRPSLAHGARMARQTGIRNVRFVQGDLLDIDSLGERFDAVFASGVLHHMADPERGIRILAGVLRPGGVVRIGLYSEHAREPLAKARAHAEEAGHGGSPDGIRAFRRAVLTGGLPEVASLLESPDFYTVSSCRDLVFHVHERRFTIPQVSDALAGAGLRLLGFDAGRETRARYLRRHPGDPHMRSFEDLARFEEGHPGAFSGMYLLWAANGSPGT